MKIKILPVDKPEIKGYRKLANVDIVFEESDGILNGLSLVGTTIVEQNNELLVNFPANFPKPEAASQRAFFFLRPTSRVRQTTSPLDGLRNYILDLFEVVDAKR